MRKAIAIAALVVAAAGCGDQKNHGVGDAPVGHHIDNSAPVKIIDFPDQFMNLAFKCNGSDGIYAHTREAAPVIVPNDANCPSRR